MKKRLAGLLGVAAVLTLCSASVQAQAPTAVVLGSLEAEKSFDLRITGFGLEYVTVRVTSKHAGPLTVSVPVGMMFTPRSPSVQTMVVRRPATIRLARSGVSQEVKVNVSCIEMAKDSPGESDEFSVSSTAARPELAKLLSAPGFVNQSFRVQQFAIWTVTDNPRRDSYPGIGAFVATEPTVAEFEAIRALLVAAGLDAKAYRAYQ